jgi:hypothetical protein
VSVSILFFKKLLLLLLIKYALVKSVFNSVVTDAFQIIFRVKMHANDFFLFFLKLFFDISTLKRSKTYKPY